ncbi:hypothetical protein KFK09_007961 [Dendrobium nobile]|uniref:Uncharacterized protein n=1 Tax=Dendrobium nobile TaxID=94219 RepID=A0A8T3BT99_DENNO|nr:hypothetical protein KFK09_007961 [Dendrobium nobile]
MEPEERYRWSGTCVEKKEVRRPRRKRRSSQAFLEEKESGKSSQAFPKKTLRFISLSSQIFTNLSFTKYFIFIGQRGGEA